jgi:hypothetical protein
MREFLRRAREEFSTSSFQNTARKAVADGRVTQQGGDIFLDGKPCPPKARTLFRLLLREMDTTEYPSETGPAPDSRHDGVEPGAGSN